MPIAPPAIEIETADPVLIFQGGADTLQLEEGGKIYYPGDPLPKNLSHARRAGLRAAGIRIETRHTEPVVMPDGEPATSAGAAQIDGPAVVAATDDVPTTEAPARAASTPRKVVETSPH